MFNRSLCAALALTLVLPASAAPQATKASPKPPAAKPAPASEAAKPTPPPSPFDSWARPLADAERGLPASSTRAKASRRGCGKGKPPNKPIGAATSRKSTGTASATRRKPKRS